MSFAPEPILDAVTPPPAARGAPRAPAPDDGGQSFEDHLDAVDEPAAERPASARNEAKDDAAQAPVEIQVAENDDAPDADQSLDVDAALLGGLLPPAPPPMAAPVVVQIVASQPQQTAVPDTEAEAAPVNALPEAPTAAPTEADTLAAQATPDVAAKDKHAPAEAKPAAPEAIPAPASPQTTNGQAAQSQPNTAQQAATPVAAAELPAEVQQALASTITPAPQVAASRTAKAIAPTDEAKATSSVPDGKPEAPTPNNNAKGNAPRAPNSASGFAIDATTVAPQPQNTAPDNAQIAQSNAITTTASQASTHVQQAAVDTGAQRAAPATQVGREIIRRFDGANTSFELRLDPAELGRVEVRMEVTRDHRVTAVITADNPQALTELARHGRELEAQLQSAGLQLGENGLSFDLRQGSQGGDAEHANASTRGGDGDEALSEQPPAPVARPIGYERWRGVRVDMMV
ncbi:MAG: flagellar hook-length control protein FliK [Hyphomonadaceae bacterium]